MVDHIGDSAIMCLPFIIEMMQYNTRSFLAFKILNAHQVAKSYRVVMRNHPHFLLVYLGCGGAGCERIGEGSVGVGVGGITIGLSMEKRLDPPKLSMDFMYSDALFSIIKASSNSRTMSTMHGRYAEKVSIHAKATSTTLHIASAWYPPFMLGSTISSIREFLI